MITHESIIGTRLRIEYFDYNDKFALNLPCHGTIIRQLKSQGGVDDWFLLKLDTPFDYQDAVTVDLLHCEQILVRSRWKGYSVGEIEPTSVFILLIPSQEYLDKEPIQVEKFCHIAWGMSYTEST